MITTVIPTFERPKMLKRAIESALDQNIDRHQINIYDNASSDNTEEVVRDYCKRDRKVQYFRNESNIGGANNIYNGVMRVSTPYYTILSDDDFLLPGFYRNALDAFAAFPEAALVCSKTLTIDIINKRIEHRNTDWQGGNYHPSTSLSRKMYDSHFVSTSVMFSQEVKNRLGPFDPLGSDSLYMTMAAATFPFAVLNQYGAAVTLHQEAYSIVGEGLNKESISNLNQSFLKSVQLVMTQDIPDDRKVALLNLYFNRLYQTFESKRLKYLTEGSTDEFIDQVVSMPYIVSNRGIISNIYSRSPDFLKPFVKSAYQLIHRINLLKTRNSNGKWVPLSSEAYEQLRACETDITKLNLGL